MGQYDRPRIGALPDALAKAYRAEQWSVKWPVIQALKSGALVRPPKCSRCGGKGSPTCQVLVPIVGHHDDYRKPLAVTWLCRSCHRKRHVEIGWLVPAACLVGTPFDPLKGAA